MKSRAVVLSIKVAVSTLFSILSLIFMLLFRPTEWSFAITRSGVSLLARSMSSKSGFRFWRPMTLGLAAATKP
jgi:hypothetical protein